MKHYPYQMQDKVALLTGATSGMGRRAALELAGLGAKLYLVCLDRTDKDKTAAESLLKEIRRKSGNDNIVPLYADLSSQGAIRRVVGEFLKSGDPLHVLINNAAVFGLKERMTSPEGHEMHLAVNFLASYTLTALLLERLRQSAPARIINIVSGSPDLTDAEMQDLLDDYNGEANYHYRLQYRLTKLCGMFFTRTLSDKVKQSGITVNCIDPGLVFTNIQKNAGWVYRLNLRWRARNYDNSIDDAVGTYLYLSCSPEVENITGKYFFKNTEKAYPRVVLDDKFTLQAWNIAERLTGISIDSPEN